MSTTQIDVVHDFLKTRLFVPRYECFAERARHILNRHDGDDYPFAGFGYAIDFPKETDYDKNLHEYLNFTATEALFRWAKEYLCMPRQTSQQLNVLILGQMHPSICKNLLKVICEIADKNKEVKFMFVGYSDKFRMAVEDLFKTTLTGFSASANFNYQIGRTYSFDIMISSHYIQHRSLHYLEQFIEGKWKRQFILKTGGLFIWASALSRNARKSEFVCEGFFPMKTSRRKTEGLAEWDITHMPIGEYPATENKLYYSRYDSQGVTPDGMFEEFPYALEYVDSSNPKHNKEVVGKLIKTFIVEDFRKFNCEVNRINISRKYAVEDKCYGCMAYWVVKIDYRYDKQRMEAYFIVSDGAGRTLSTLENHRRLTFYFARSIDQITALDFDNVQNSLMALGAAVNDQSICSMRLIKEGRRVVRILPDACDMFSNRYLMVLHQLRGRKNSLVYSILPMRRYIHKDWHDQYLNSARIGDPKLESFLRKECNCRQITTFRPVSVTALLSFQELMKVFSNLGIVIGSNPPFFYRCYHKLDRNWKLKMKVDGFETGDELSRIIEMLSKDNASAERDKAFNKLKLADKLSLLGPLNVHNVLFIGTKDVCASRRKRYFVDVLKRWRFAYRKR